MDERNGRRSPTAAESKEKGKKRGNEGNNTHQGLLSSVASSARNAVPQDLAGILAAGGKGSSSVPGSSSLGNRTGQQYADDARSQAFPSSIPPSSSLSTTFRTPAPPSTSSSSSSSSYQAFAQGPPPGLSFPRIEDDDRLASSTHQLLNLQQSQPPSLPLTSPSSSSSTSTANPSSSSSSSLAHVGPYSSASDLDAAFHTHVRTTTSGSIYTTIPSTSINSLASSSTPSQGREGIEGMYEERWRHNDPRASHPSPSFSEPLRKVDVHDVQRDHAFDRGYGNGTMERGREEEGEGFMDLLAADEQQQQQQQGAKGRDDCDHLPRGKTTHWIPPSPTQHATISLEQLEMHRALALSHQREQEEGEGVKEKARQAEKKGEKRKVKGQEEEEKVGETVSYRHNESIRPPCDSKEARTGVYAPTPALALAAIWDGEMEGTRIKESIESEIGMNQSGRGGEEDEKERDGKAMKKRGRELSRMLRAWVQRGSYVDDVYGLPPELEKALQEAEVGREDEEEKEGEEEEMNEKRARAIQRLNALHNHLFGSEKGPPMKGAVSAEEAERWLLENK